MIQTKLFENTIQDPLLISKPFNFSHYFLVSQTLTSSQTSKFTFYNLDTLSQIDLCIKIADNWILETFKYQNNYVILTFSSSTYACCGVIFSNLTLNKNYLYKINQTVQGVLKNININKMSFEYLTSQKSIYYTEGKIVKTVDRLSHFSNLFDLWKFPCKYTPLMYSSDTYTHPTFIFYRTTYDLFLRDYLKLYDYITNG